MFHMLITFVLLVSVSIIHSAQPGFKTLLRTILTNSEVIAISYCCYCFRLSDKTRSSPRSSLFCCFSSLKNFFGKNAG